MHHRGPIFSLLEMDSLGNGYRIGEPGRLALTYTSCVLLSPSQDLPVMDRYGRTIQPFSWTSASRNRERANSLSCISTAGERLLNDIASFDTPKQLTLLSWPWSVPTRSPRRVSQTWRPALAQTHGFNRYWSYIPCIQSHHNQRKAVCRTQKRPRR